MLCACVCVIIGLEDALKETLAEKFAPDYPEGRNAEINKLYTAFLMLEMRIEHMTGKQAKELVKA